MLGVSVSGAEKLSPSAEISVLTCGPGKPLYAAFGHTALLVQDSELGIDQVFNYGTFDANTPNFYIKFLTGRLKYALSVSDFDTFLLEYKLENRWIYRQDLEISPLQKQRIYDSLMIVMKPENRYYLYDFFRNNCSTKVIDLLLFFVADQPMIDSLKSPSGISFREALRPYIGGREWLNLGINMLLGPFADQPMSKLQSTYLPENLMHELEKTRIAGTSRKILGDGYQPPERQNPDLPMILFWVLAFILIFEALWKNGNIHTTKMIDAILFSFAGILGLLFVFLWIWSNHVSLHLNLNLFWANPFNFILVWAILKEKKIMVKVYAVIYMLLIFFMLINWSKLPQRFPLELMPIVTLLAFRAVNRIFNFRLQDKVLVSKSMD